MCGLLCPVPIIVPTLSEYTFDAGKTAGCDTRVLEVVDTEQQGFTKTVNRGIRWALESEPDYVCILNDDAYPSDTTWLLRLIEEMGRGFQLGIAGPSGLCATRPQVYGVPHMEPGAHVVKQLAFFCVVVDVNVFHAIGLMDEEFIHYGSDNDFVLRAAEVGWTSIWVPDVYIVHSHKASESAATDKWRKHDTKVLAKKWPDLVHGSVRGLRRPQRPGRQLAGVVADRLQRQRVVDG